MAELRRDADTDEHESFRIASASYGVRSIPETDRLKLARQLLLSLGVLTVGFVTW